MYFVKTPWYLKTVYPSLVWDIPKSKTVYLTFDDGPVPDVTDKVLDILSAYQIKATFFCIGDNVVKHNNLFSRIQNEGHAIGNHTFHHLNGWKTENALYVNDVFACAEKVETQLFRPPYGRIGFNQIQELKKHFTIVMWDVLSCDFDTTIDADACYQNVVNNVDDGSVIVFHDSLKALDRVLPALPKVIDTLLAQGYHFEPIAITNNVAIPTL